MRYLWGGFEPFRQDVDDADGGDPSREIGQRGPEKKKTASGEFGQRMAIPGRGGRPTMRESDRIGQKKAQEDSVDPTVIKKGIPTFDPTPNLELGTGSVGATPVLEEEAARKKGPGFREAGTISFKQAEITEEDLVASLAKNQAWHNENEAMKAQLLQEKLVSPEFSKTMKLYDDVSGPERTKKMLDEAVPEMRKKFNDLDAQMEDVMNREIDPTRMFQNGAGVSAAIAVAAGTLSSSILGPGAPNVANAIIQSALQRDLHAQVSEAANARASGGIRANILGQLRGTLGDELQVMQYMQGLKAKAVQAELAKHANNGNQDAFAKLVELGLKIDKQGNEAKSQAKSGAYEAKMKAHMGRDSDQQALQIQGALNALNPELTGAPVPQQQAAPAQQAAAPRARRPRIGGGGKKLNLQSKPQSQVSMSERVDRVSAAGGVGGILGNPVAAAGRAIQQRGHEQGEVAAEREAAAEQEAFANSAAARFPELKPNMQKWVDEFEASSSAIKITHPKVAYAAEVDKTKGKASPMKKFKADYLGKKELQREFLHLRGLAKDIRKEIKVWAPAGGTAKAIETILKNEDSQLMEMMETFRQKSRLLINNPFVSKEMKTINIAKASDKDLEMFMTAVGGDIGADKVFTINSNMRAWDSATDRIMRNANRQANNSAALLGLKVNSLVLNSETSNRGAADGVSRK